MKNINKIIKVSFITNMFLSIIKIIIGYIGSSSSLIADGIHSFSDLVTDIGAMVGNFFSIKPADEEHPFGHGKLEYVTCFFIGIIIITMGLSLIGSINKTEIIIPSRVVIICSIFTIISKYLLSSYLMNKGNLFNNSILISSAKESKSDVLSSIVVLLSSICMQYSNQIQFLKYSDKIATIIVGIFIVKTGFDVIKENMSMLLGEREKDENIINDMHNCILSHKEIKRIDKFLLMKNGPYYTVTSEVSMNGNISLQKAHSIIDGLEAELYLKCDRIKYINIHINPY